MVYQKRLIFKNEALKELTNNNKQTGLTTNERTKYRQLILQSSLTELNEIKITDMALLT